MNKVRLSEWWGLYLLVPLMSVLMVIDIEGIMSHIWHRILLAGIIIAICALAVSWVDRHPRLVERGGVGLKDRGNEAGSTQMRVTRVLLSAFEDDCEAIPIRHSGTDDCGAKE